MTYYKWRVTYQNSAGPWCEARHESRQVAFAEGFLDALSRGRAERDGICSLVVKKFEEGPLPEPEIDEFEDFDEFDKY